MQTAGHWSLQQRCNSSWMQQHWMQPVLLRVGLVCLIPSYIAVAMTRLFLPVAVSISQARQVPGLAAPAISDQPGNSDSSQQRALLYADSIQAANKHSHKDAASKAVHTAQLGGDVADPPPFVGAEVRKGASVEPLQVGPGFGGGPGFNGGNFNGGGFDGGNFNGGGFGGTPQWLNVAGVTANAVGYGVNVGTALVAPIVNGVASNIPLMLPSLADGQCFRGQPLFIPRLNRVMCVVGSAASVTNYMFRAANVLVNAAAGGVGLASQIASVAGK